MKPEEALDQISYLRELVQQSRLRVAWGYPHFLLWGALWVIGYLGALWTPEPQRLWVWPAVYSVGAIGSATLSTMSGRGAPVPALLKKLGWINLVLLAGSVLLLVFFVGFSDRHSINAFWPFQIGTFYIVSGLLIGQELVLIGSWLVFAALVSLWMASPIQDIWLALVGGGGLILTGILLRRQVKKG